MSSNTVVAKPGPIMDPRMYGLIRNQRLVGMIMEDINFADGKMRDMNLCGVQISNCSIDENTTIDGISVLEALRTFKNQEPV